MSALLAIELFGWFLAAASPAVTLQPFAVDDCFVVPDAAATVRWKIEGRPPLPMSYAIRDYSDNEVASGEAKPAGEGVVETPLRLPRGFYEIEFPAAGQRFGIVAMPPWQGPAESFFAIDGALSWLVHDAATREGLVRVARRSGIRMIRERLTWGSVQPGADRNDWETPLRFDALRQVYARHGVEALEMVHDTPAWLGRVGKYPRDLVATARCWQAIAGHWQPTWGALEIWNEPDIFFGASLPADQYVALAKAIAYGLSEIKIQVPLIGGAVAHCNRAFLDAAAENGLLGCIDAFSFHTYGRAMEMEGLAAKYRDWLKTYADDDRGGRVLRMPLWITECGRPWKKGPQRPPADQDAESALDIVMKGVEARACGIARYFPFVYPFYEENDNNFGMMDKRATPLRSFAAYAQMIQAMHGTRYAGDLKIVDTAVRRARWFSKSAGPNSPPRDLAVIYTGRRDRSAVVRINVPVERVEGIDGRILPHDADSVPVPDGLAYVWLKKEGQAAGRPSAVDSGTAAMALYRLKADCVPRTAPSPIILRYVFDPATVEPKSEGYRLKTSPGRTMSLAVQVFNLAAESRSVRLDLTWGSTRQSPPMADREPRPAVRQIVLPPRSSADMKWEVDLSQAFAENNEVKAVVRVLEDQTRSPENKLVLRFFGEATLAQTLRRFEHRFSLPIGEMARWTPHVAGIGKMRMDATSEAAWRLQVEFGQGDHWVYPSFLLPGGLRMNEQVGLVVRARCAKPAEVRVFLWEGDTGVGYLTPHSVIAADGQWHVALIRFGDLVLSAANRPDPNGQLDLDQIRRISVGMNAHQTENTLELSDLVVVGGTK